ncbi:hypothetical protein HY745_02640 [Candidatus Desantisbacteria bacterium]|nr:hypothetical protein [Candidatus Desantisbacteria bacterium]
MGYIWRRDGTQNGGGGIQSGGSEAEASHYMSYIVWQTNYSSATGHERQMWQASLEYVIHVLYK